MPENEKKKLNPQITDVEIGVRNLRKITIYPLSMGDQLKLTDLVINGITEQVGDGEGADLSVSFIVNLIQENLGKILTMVSDEKETILDELSNAQATEIAEILFDVNYGTVAKNFKRLSEKVMNLFQLERPSPPSANDTDTSSKISIESATKTEA